MVSCYHAKTQREIRAPQPFINAFTQNTGIKPNAEPINLNASGPTTPAM
jgi:hypothetical protein